MIFFNKVENLTDHDSKSIYSLQQISHLLIAARCPHPPPIVYPYATLGGLSLCPEMRRNVFINSVSPQGGKRMLRHRSQIVRCPVWIGPQFWVKPKDPRARSRHGCPSLSMICGACVRSPYSSMTCA
jgi:hypothetical protein